MRAGGSGMEECFVLPQGTSLLVQEAVLHLVAAITVVLLWEVVPRGAETSIYTL